MIGTLSELLSHSYHVGQFTQLEAVARTILTAIPDDMVALHFLGLAYLRTGRTGEADHLFHSLAPESARHAEEDAPLGAAKALYRETTDLNPAFADTWYDIALELNRMGHGGQALSALRNAIAARQDFREALLAMGNIGLQCGDRVAAERGFSGLLACEPDNAAARRGLEQASRVPQPVPKSGLLL